MSPDGSLCASGGKDAKAMLWDLNDGKHLYTLDHQGRRTCCRLPMCERRCYSLLPQDRISLLLASLLSGLGHLTSNLLRSGTLDDTDSNRLPHVSDGESTKGWELGEGLHAHRLGRNQLDDGSISRLDELRCIFCGFTGTSVNLLQDL